MATAILHIDERLELPQGFTKTLHEEGYTLVQTTDPEEAIKLFDERKPALVLMELEFRGCDGPDLIAGIRSRERGEVPILVLTRAPRQSVLHSEAIALGVVDFLSKPANRSELLSAIREAAPLPPKVEARATPRQSPKSESAGSFDAEPLFEVLATLHRRGTSGVLLATSGKAKMGIQLRNGSVVAIESRRRQARRERTQDISEEEVARAIARRAEAEIFDAFRWTEGSYKLAEKRRLRSDSSLEVLRDTGSLLLAGVLEASSLQWARDWLRKRATLYICSSAESRELLDAAELSPEQVQKLTELGGEDTLGDLIDSGLFGERLLYGLILANWMELHTEPLLALTLPELDLEDELEDELDDLDDLLEVEFGGELDEELGTQRGNGLDQVLDQVLDAGLSEVLDAGLGEEIDAGLGEEIDAGLGEVIDEGFGEMIRDELGVELYEEAVVTGPSTTPPEDEPTLPPASGNLVRRVVKKARALSSARVSRAPMGAAPPRAEISTAEKVIDERFGELADQVMAGDDFEALGLSLSAADRDVRAAYERLLQQIPDAQQVAANDVLRDQAERVRKRIDAAYLHLKDSEARCAHVELREEKWRDEQERGRADRSLEAERWFRKGKDLLKSKKYDRAGEAFGMASHLDPDEGDYLSHLGWALYLANPDEDVVQREAMEHIARAIKTSPNRELSYVYLGRIVQAKGNLKTARRIFDRALEMNPDCEAASQALRLLGEREEKSKGLLSRLWRRCGR